METRKERQQYLNQLGQQVHQEKLNGKTNIKVNKRGVYLVRVTCNKRSITKKVYLN
ncbi:MAG: T9SS type A sorting domain-containing protein [Flavobacteriales bacterium]|nr:T9SS type A sorting domain-containing protein [Flavobacteriales bacterium]